jgi:localization factor PodJL
MMNRSKSDTPRQGDRTPGAPAGHLNETAATRAEEPRSSLLRARPDDATRLTRSTQISEILDRQKLLSRNRPPPPAAANLSLADQIRERLRSPAAPASPSAPISAPRSDFRASDYRASDYRQPSAEHAAFDISEALAKLRHDLKQDLAISFSQEIASLRHEIKEIGAAVAESGYPQDLYADLQRLAEGMEYITQTTENAVTNSMRNELGSLRMLVDGVARQDDLAVMLEHFDALRQQFADADSSAQVNSLNSKIGSLADAIEMLVSQMSSADRDMNSQMHTLDERLAEIVAAIDANAIATAELSGDAGFGALEARVARLIEDIDATSLPQRDSVVVERIEGLAARMEELAKLQATEHLDRRFDELAALLKQGGTSAAGEDLSAVISDISQKIDDMARGTVSSELINRFDDLVSRIDNLDGVGAQGGLSEEILTWLEGRMNDIATRIDSNVQAKGNPAADLGALEEQISTLTKLLSEPRVATDVNAAQMTSRMSALEDYMSTNDEYIVEAARQAAETALEAYVRNFAGQANGAGVSNADLTMISDLASDLHALEELTRSGEARNQQTFETLQNTLVQIADRLDQLGMSAAAAAAPVVAKAQAASRPRLRTGTDTELFSNDFDDDLFDDDIALDTATAREGDKPLKGLLSSIGKRFRSNQEDVKSEEPRRTVESAPAIDAADDISPDLANQLLEPGSGAPDIRQILEKVRAVQEGKPAKKESPAPREDDNSDYIAVARRAAQAAAAEIDPAARSAEAAEASTSIIGKYRRPLLLGTGLVLLAVMGWPLVSTMFVSQNAPAPAQQAAISEPAPADKAPVETKAPAAEAGSLPTATATEPTAPVNATDAAPAMPSAMTPPVDVPAPPAIASEPAQAPTAEATPPQSAATEAAPAPAVTEPPPAAAKAEPSAAPAAPPADAAAATTPAAPAAAAQPTPAMPVPAGIEPQALVDAANGNDALAIYEVGNRIFDGRGVPANPAGALAWYTRAASMGFVPAEYRLGSIYEKGAGVSVDPAKAVEHYTIAAKAGNISAMHNLAVLYATGTLGAPDFASAAKWFTEAANHGVRDSQFNLAILYAKGSGVTQNLEQSYKWFGVAAKDGDTDAAQKRDEVGKVLTGDQLTKAKADVEGWKSAPADDKANATIIPDAWAGKAQKTSSVDMKKAITYIQAMLNKNGFDVGRPDGVMGAKTVAAIKQFQSSVGQQPTGDINDALVKELIARSK